MASCTIRKRTDNWIEVVLPAPTYAGELGKAHNIMLGQLGLTGAVSHDDVYQVLVGDDEIILRAKAPTAMATIGATWHSDVVQKALAVLEERAERGVHMPIDGQTIDIAIAAIRAIVREDADA